MTHLSAVRRPSHDEYLEYYEKNVDLIPDGDLLTQMEWHVPELRLFFTFHLMTSQKRGAGQMPLRSDLSDLLVPQYPLSRSYASVFAGHHGLAIDATVFQDKSPQTPQAPALCRSHPRSSAVSCQ